MKSLLSREPVRLYVYGCALALIAVLVALGLVDDSMATLWSALAAALLAVPAAELPRSVVTSPATLAEQAATPLPADD